MSKEQKEQMSPKRGKSEIRKLLYKGFSFTFHKLVIGRQQKYWRCKKRKQGCKAQIWTDLENEVVSDRCENVHLDACHKSLDRDNCESTNAKSMI